MFQALYKLTTLRVVADNIINRPTTAVATLDQSSQATLRGNVAQCRSQLRSNSAAVEVLAPRAGAPALWLLSLVSTEPVNFYLSYSFFLHFTRGMLKLWNFWNLMWGRSGAKALVPPLCDCCPVFQPNRSAFTCLIMFFSGKLKL